MSAMDYFDKIMKIETEVMRGNKSEAIKYNLSDIINCAMEDDITKAEFDELYTYYVQVMNRLN